MSSAQPKQAAARTIAYTATGIGALALAAALAGYTTAATILAIIGAGIAITGAASARDIRTNRFTYLAALALNAAAAITAVMLNR